MFVCLAYISVPVKVFTLWPISGAMQRHAKKNARRKYGISVINYFMTNFRKLFGVYH